MGRSWESFKRERLAQESESEAYRAGKEKARIAFEVGEQIRELRESRGMTQQQLAERAGTSQPAIARMEGGGVDPKVDTLERVGLALGMQLVVRFEARKGVGTLEVV